MTTKVVRLRALVVVVVAACAHAPPPAPPVIAHAPPPPPPPPKLVVLLAESDAFPNFAKATTESLLGARVSGLGNAQVSKVSLEVVQLSIECVDASVVCYEAVGRSLAANGLLFAQIAVVQRKRLKVTVTLFDVDTKTLKTKAEKVFTSEDAARAGIADLVAEATRP
jgi:hypothetical protein